MKDLSVQSAFQMRDSDLSVTSVSDVAARHTITYSASPSPLKIHQRESSMEIVGEAIVEESEFSSNLSSRQKSRITELEKIDEEVNASIEFEQEEAVAYKTPRPEPPKILL